MKLGVCVRAFLPFVAAFALAPSCARAAVPEAAGAGVAQEWQRFLASADGDVALPKYAVLSKLTKEDGSPDAAACRANAAALDEAIAAVPVGLALEYAAYRCSEAVADAPAAERHLARFSALAKYALAQASDDPLAPPIQVVVMADIYALIEASGLTLRYEWLDFGKSWRYFTLNTAVWDEESKHERVLRFDYADTITRLQRANASAAYPAFRAFLREDFLRQLTRIDRTAAFDINAVRAAVKTASTKDAVALLRPAAEQGGVQSQRVWLVYCDAKPFDGCGAGLIDSLLPLAEKRQVLPTIFLALANARGLGVKKNEDAAMTLLDSAEAQWGEGRAIVEYARILATIDKRPYPKALQSRLDRAAAEGNPDPEIMAIQARISADPDGNASAKDLQRLIALADSDRREVLGMIATQLFYSPQRTESVPWLRRASEAGLSNQQERLGYSLLVGDSLDLPLDREKGLYWLREAAASGNSVAMYTLGQDAVAHQDWKGAEGWFSSEDVSGDSDGTFALASLWAAGHPGLRGDSAQSLKMLRAMSDAGKEEAPRARRAIAELLVAGTSLPKDPVTAEKLLRQDADSGNALSQMALARYLLDGRIGRKDEVEGVALYQKAMSDPKQGAAAGDSLAFWLYYSKKAPEARERAVAIWRSLSYDVAWNNLAWVLCTAREPSLRNPKEALALLDKLGKPEAQDAGTMDTYAACDAANGRFDEAAAMQVKVIARTRAAKADDADLPAMSARLEGYRAGKAFIESEQPMSTR